MHTKNDKNLQNNYKVIKDDKVTEDDIRQALELDRKYYTIPKEEQFKIEKCLYWNRKTGYKVYTMIKDSETGDVVGYINAVPVNDKCYKEIKAGKYADAYIDDNDIICYDHYPIEPQKYNLYFASIVVEKKHRYEGTFVLSEAFFDKLIVLTKKNIIIQKMVADAVSPQGKSYCKRAGMKEIKNTEHDNSTIYELELYPPNFIPRTPKQKELMDKYKELESLN